MVQNTSYAAEAHGSLLVLVLVALIVGAAAGLVGAIFRLTLEQADRLRDALIAWAQGENLAGFLFVVATCASAALIAAWLVRRFSPHASGSGIPHVEAVLNEELPQAPFHLIWVKFCGGVLAIGSGLALGREGPSVQMGASVAHLVGKVFRREWPDCRVLLAAGAGAGLATAFNALAVDGGASSGQRVARDLDRLRAAQSQQPDDRLAQVDGGHAGEEVQAARRERPRKRARPGAGHGRAIASTRRESLRGSTRRAAQLRLRTH